MTTTIDLDTLELASGKHGSRQKGVCLLEAVAWYAGENHSDMPDCVSPVLRSYGITLNDSLPHAERQALKQFIPALVGTAGDGHDAARRALAREVLLTQWLPQWLRLAKLDDLAVKAEAAQHLTGAELIPALYEIRDLTWQARRDRWEPFRKQVREAVEKRLREQGKPETEVVAAAMAAAMAEAEVEAAAVDVAMMAGVAAAMAAEVAAEAAMAAAAAAMAVGVAEVVAAAMAAEVAEAAVAAVAVGVVEVVAAAMAAEVAEAAVAVDSMPEYGTDAYWTWRNALYTRVRIAVREALDTDDRLAEVRALRDQHLAQGITLYQRLIDAR